METVGQVRIDKFLWAVRLFKTRSQASEACRNGKITMHGYPVKSSRIISMGEIFSLKRNPVVYTYKIKEVLSNRVGPKLVEMYIENLTPPEEMLKLQADDNFTIIRRDKGTGRPTKKERREIDKLNEFQ
jgi:ribosome-associated heat shock protein Hsp15